MRTTIGIMRLLLLVVLSAVMVGGLLGPASAADADGTARHSGQVTHGTNAAPGIEVVIFRETPSGWVTDQTVVSNEQGYYSFTGDPAVDYRLKFHDPSGRLRDLFWHNKTDLESADNVRVGARQPDGSRTIMATGSQVSGRVTNELGEPLPLATVTWYGKDADGQWSPLGSVQSDRRGYYLFQGVTAGEYRLGFGSGAGTGYVAEFWGDAATVEDADDVVVRDDDTTLALHDTVMTPGGRVLGTVVDQAGKLLTGIPVQLYRQEATGWTKIQDGSTDEGRYWFANLPTGTYRVGFSYKNGKYVRVFWDGADTVESATDIPVIVREDTAGIDVSLTEALTIGYWKEPMIVGSRRVGSPLTVDPGVWDPPVTLTYQWVGSCSLCAIEGATSSTYTPTEEYLGRTIGVEITASRKGHKDLLVVPSKFVVLPATDPFSAAATVKINGSGVAGRRMHAVTTSAWSPTPDAVSFQWFVDDRAQPGANQPWFDPARSSVGQRVRVEMTAVKAGYTTATVSSGSRSVLANSFVMSSRPTVRGIAKVGKTLRLSAGVWSPRPQRISYRWYANGRVIPRAVGSTYKIAKKYQGRRISVRVTVHSDGFNVRTEASKPTRKVTRKR